MGILYNSSKIMKLIPFILIKLILMQHLDLNNMKNAMEGFSSKYKSIR